MLIVIPNITMVDLYYYPGEFKVNYLSRYNRAFKNGNLSLINNGVKRIYTTNKVNLILMNEAYLLSLYNHI